MADTGLDNKILITLLECSSNILELNLSKNKKINLLFDSHWTDLILDN